MQGEADAEVTRGIASSTNADVEPDADTYVVMGDAKDEAPPAIGGSAESEAKPAVPSGASATLAPEETTARKEQKAEVQAAKDRLKEGAWGRTG